MNGEITKLLTTDTMGHTFATLKVPRVIKGNDGVYRHQISLNKVCTKCHRIQQSIAKIKPCGTKHAPPRGLSAGGIHQRIERVEADAKLVRKYRPPGDVTVDALTNMYTEAIRALKDIAAKQDAQ